MKFLAETYSWPPTIGGTDLKTAAPCDGRDFTNRINASRLRPAKSTRRGVRRAAGTSLRCFFRSSAVGAKMPGQRCKFTRTLGLMSTLEGVDRQPHLA